MDLLAKNGMKAVLATPSGAKPDWMAAKYPEIRRVNAYRVRELQGGRHNHCLSSPVYREKVTEMNTRLAERYKNHPALGVWHVSNEYGGECHCPLCQEKFRQWLKNKYKTLDALNAAWWTGFWSHTYTDWSQIESPSPFGESNLTGLTLDWRRFTSDQFIDFYKCETAPLKKITPDVPCTANMMGTYPGLNYFDLSRALDVASWDNYPQWTGGDDTDWGGRTAFTHDLTRSFKMKPFMMMESSPSATNWRQYCKLHRPGVLKLESLQALAHGADTVQYFQFRSGRGGPEKYHGAVVTHSATENTRVFHDVAEVGAEVAKLDALVGADYPAEAAVIYDWNIRWILDITQAFLQKKTDYEGTVIAHHNAFWRRGINTDVIDETFPLDKYKVVAAPMLYMLRPGMEKKIADFVEKGGTFIATYITGWADENDISFMGGFPGGKDSALRRVLGIWEEEVDGLYPEDKNGIEYKGKTYEAHGLCSLIHAESAQVLGTYASDFYKGQPAFTCNSFGKGKAYFIAARTGEDFLDAFYGKIAADAGLKTTGLLPHGVSVSTRTNGKDTFTFLLNFTNESKALTLNGAKCELGAFESKIVRS
jgi:beta-galactosidase